MRIQRVAGLLTAAFIDPSLTLLPIFSHFSLTPQFGVVLLVVEDNRKHGLMTGTKLAH